MFVEVFQFTSMQSVFFLELHVAKRWSENYTSGVDIKVSVWFIFRHLRVSTKLWVDKYMTAQTRLPKPTNVAQRPSSFGVYPTQRRAVVFAVSSLNCPDDI